MKKERNSKTNTGYIKLGTLSGNSEVGRNSAFLEDRKTIIIVDAGLSFPEQEIFGIDYLIPNLSYLKQNKKKVKAIFITHGHLDHIGALPYMLPELGFPKIYAGSFAASLIRNKLKEFSFMDKVRIIETKRNEVVNIDNFRVKFVGVTHSIPHAFSLFIETKAGNVFFSGDFKIDDKPANEQQTDYETLRSLQGKVNLALIESTNSTAEGSSTSETEVATTIAELIKTAPGRVFIASFASQVTRLYVVSKIAASLDKKIVLVGRSLKDAFQIARDLKYIDLPDSLFVPPTHINKYDPKQLVFLCTGSQGEHYGALNLISRGENRNIKLKPSDRVILSSSEIPGNEYKIGKMTDRLIKSGVELITSKLDTVHATGHGLQEDLRIMYDLIRPKNVMPIHGTLTMRYFNKLNFIEWGMPKSNIHLTEDGFLWQVSRDNINKLKSIPSKPVLVDGMGISDVGDIVLADREKLAEYGMICVVLNLSQKNKTIIGRVNFASRGFIYMNRSKELLTQLDKKIRSIHQDWHDKSRNSKRYEVNELKDDLTKKISSFLYSKTKREPIVLVVIT